MNPAPRSVFLSHSSEDSWFVVQVGGFLARCFEHVFCYEDYQLAGDFKGRMQTEVATCEVFVFFVGNSTHKSRWQIREANASLDSDRLIIPVQLPGADGKPFPIPPETKFQDNHLSVRPKGLAPADAREVATQICHLCGLPWKAVDGLPAEPNLFSYEKAIIDFYQELTRHGGALHLKTAQRFRDKILKGCPAHWPAVERRNLKPIRPNKLIPDIGSARAHSAHVRVSVLETEPGLGEGTGMSPPLLTFPEAGPRERLCFPIDADKPMKVAVMVVGGIAPGINAVIDGIVQRHFLYAGETGKLQVVGLFNGVQAFENWDESHCCLFCDDRSKSYQGGKLETPQHAHEGGSILGTCRDDELLSGARRDDKLKEIVRQLKDYSILYVIGGDGGMRLAHAIQNYATKDASSNLSVVGIPKTMDNDILWVWQSFGFMSAVEKAREVIEHIHTEIISNPRLGIVQLFGSVSGFVVSHAVLAGSTPRCYLALVPEVEFKLEEVARYLAEKLKSGPIPGGLVVMAETALPTDALEILAELDKAEDRSRTDPDSGARTESLLTIKEKETVEAYLKLRKENKTLSGQTSDHLRSACLKIVSKGLEFLLKRKGNIAGNRWDKLRVVTNEPRHIIRAIPPSCLDIITGRRLGGLAVDNAMAGYTDFMISQWLTEFVMVPLSLVVLGRKQIHREGIFWKSVLAKTGSWKCFEVQGGGKSRTKSSKLDAPSDRKSKR